MKVFFRADASVQIGSGHIIRCLALADRLRSKGVSCQFVCRNDPGNLIEIIRTSGFKTVVLQNSESQFTSTSTGESYGFGSRYRLGIDCELDAIQTKRAIDNEDVDWLIVDHYALDASWERALRQNCTRIMAIDDLADRPHDCDLLVDQTLGRKKIDYKGLVTKKCRLLLGPRYSLLRHEFSQLRANSSIRSKLNRILVFLGGSDPSNETLKVLTGLGLTKGSWKIDVVIGAGNPHRNCLEKIVSENSSKFSMYVQTEKMAKLMLDADLAIGAAGSASWERCCLRLPSIVCVLAKNQQKIANELHSMDAVLNLGDAINLEPLDYANAIDLCTNEMLTRLSKGAGVLVDGRGVDRVTHSLLDMDFGGAA